MRFLKLIIFCLVSTIVNAQTTNISGKLKDTSTNGNMTNALVTLYKVSDSSLSTFTRIKNDGTFSLQKPQNGRYCLLISHPKYADLIDTIKVEDNSSNLGDYYITSKKKILEQVIVRAKVSPIKIKGDTVIYTADSFKVKEGANVEDLLRKLPGIQVGRNGEITAMGETVKKVLVDGEEFFGSDPGIVTKNLQANAVDKVEVFDKKSDQATFTGIDDGVKDKTINLKLKDSKKNGYFGKLEASGGTPDNYDLQAMINAFKNKRKIAAFTMTGNIGNTNLDWEDNSSFGGGEGMSFENDENGGMWSSYQGDEFTSFWGGRNGIPKNWNGGLHYSNKLNNDKQTINLGYKYNKVNSIAENRTYTTTFLPDSTWNDNSSSKTVSSKNRNKLNGSFETKIDSLNVIKITFNIAQQEGTNGATSNSESLAKIGPINKSNRKTTSKTNGSNWDGNILWMHKFKKMNRTLSVNIGNVYRLNESDGFLFSENAYYKSGLLLRKDTIDQEKINKSENTTWSNRISYTEPLNKKILAEISYAINYNTNDNNRNSYDKDGSGKYANLAPKFSNNFAFNTTVQTPGISFKYSHKKIKWNIGTKLGFNAFKQTNLTTNTNSNYTFTNLFPSAGLNVKLKGNSGFNFNYNGNGMAPTLNQLQPIQDNTNPFYIVTGNPDLKQSFTHNFSGNYNMWNVLKQHNIWSYFNFSTQQNAFTNFSTIDTLGRTISKTVNVDGNYNTNLNFNYGFKIKKISLGISVGPNFRLNKRIDFANGLKNNSVTTAYGINLQMDKWVEDKNGENKWGFWMQHRFMQNNNKASINRNSAANFWMINGNMDLNIKLPWKIEFSTEIEYEVRQKDIRFPQNNNFALWNVELNKEIIKKTFKVGFQVKDLLNQNRGFNRNFGSYNYTESFYNTLKRYWLVTLTYKFNSQKTPTNAKK